MQLYTLVAWDSRPWKPAYSVPHAHPSSCLINNAHIFCNKPNFATATTRRTLPSTVLNMAREKKRREPPNCATAFTEKLKTTHRLCVCSYAYHVSYTFAFWKKKEPEGVRFNIRGFFFLVIIPSNKAVVRTNTIQYNKIQCSLFWEGRYMINPVKSFLTHGPLY